MYTDITIDIIIVQHPSGLSYRGAIIGHLSFMCEYGAIVPYLGKAILYFPII